LRETVEALCQTSYAQFDFDEKNRNATIGLELVFDTALVRDPALQESFGGIEQKTRKEGYNFVEVLRIR
jgi:hypothetical protein